MDLLSQHEAFLRAIFDNPEDDTARLVYADFLQENGEEDRAEFIRVQCELGRWHHEGSADRGRLIELDLLQTEIVRRIGWNATECDRGFEQFGGVARLPADSLKKVRKLRMALVSRWPGYFGVTRFGLSDGIMQTAEQVRTVFTLLAFDGMRVLDLSGEEVYDGVVTRQISACTPTAVKAIALEPHAERLTSLILTHNNLFDDSGEALVESPHLTSLTELCLGGNNISPSVWQRLAERFGPTVVRGQRPRPLRLTP